MDNALTQNLNENQLDAVMHKDGPALIIAGPGSGKTRVITSRIAWLINNEKIPIQEIAALTFTNKAANEIAKRVELALDKVSEKEKIIHGTFHSIGSKFLRRSAKLLKYNNNFKVITKKVAKYFDDEILKLNNLNIVTLDHKELEFLRLRDLLEKSSIRPIYLS